MRRKVRKIALWIISCLLLLILSGSAIIYFVLLSDEDKIKTLCIHELNQQLNTKVSIEKMNFSIFSTFPYVAINFRNIRAEGSNPNDKDALLEAHTLSLNFNIRDIFKKNYVIRRLDLSRATVRIKYYNDKTDNISVWKKTDDTTSSNFSFALRKIHIKNTHFIFINEISEQDYSLYFHKINARGNFSKDVQDIGLSGYVLVNRLKSGATTYLINKDIFLQSEFKIDSKTAVIAFQKSILRIENLDFDLFGNICYQQFNNHLDLNISGRKLQLHDLTQVLPKEHADLLNSYKSKGIFDISLQLLGQYSGLNLPAAKAKFAFSNGTIYEKNKGLNFQNVNFNGDFSCPNLNNPQQAEWSLQNLSAQVNQSILKANIKLRNFKKPTIEIHSTFNVSLSDVFDIIPVASLQDIEGRSEGQVKFKHTFGSLKEIGLNDLMKSSLNAHLICRQVNLNLTDSLLSTPVRIDSASLRIDNKDLKILYAGGQFQSYTYATALNIENLWSYLSSDKDKLSIRGNLHLDQICINTQNQNSKIGTKDFKLPERINLNIKANIPDFSFNDLQAKNLSGRVIYQNHNVEAEDLYLETLGGRVNASLKADLSDLQRAPFFVKGNLFHIDAENMLESFNNFNQNAITNKNLSGLIYADFDLYGIYSLNHGLDSKSLLFKAKTIIEQGELKEVAMLQKLSRFVDEDVLNHIKFANLENTIEIKDETIHVPEMYIRSNAMNLSVSGTHTLQNQIDYNLKIALSELLSKTRRERRRSEEEFGATTDEKKRTSLYIRITGSTENPVFKYNFKDVTANLKINKDNLKKEKETLQTAFRQEFQSPKREREKQQKALWKEQEKGKFILDWAEDSIPSKSSTPPKTQPNTKREAVKYKIEFEDD